MKSESTPTVVTLDWSFAWRMLRAVLLMTERNVAVPRKSQYVVSSIDAMRDGAYPIESVVLRAVKSLSM